MTDNVITFLPPPHVPRLVNREPASVIFLPVVRIENHSDDEPMSPGQRLRNLRRKTARDICGND